jgi:peptidase A4-like protein
MPAQEGSSKEALRLSPAPPQDFVPFAATAEDLRTHGLPQRPDARVQPHLAALWDSCARRYQGFEHLSPDIKPSGAGTASTPASLSPLENCGYSLSTTSSEPFDALFIHWTVPHLVYSPAPLNENSFHTFVEIGFLADVHVEMTVDAAQQVTSQVTVNGNPVTNLPVAPGDAMSAVMCVNAQGADGSTVFITVANETSGQTINLSAGTVDLPALSIDAGVTLNLVQNNPTLNALPRFGVVYFDEIAAYTTAGSRSLTAGTPVSMTDLHGATIASPSRLTDYAFKTVYG